MKIFEIWVKNILALEVSFSCLSNSDCSMVATKTSARVARLSKQKEIGRASLWRISRNMYTGGCIKWDSIKWDKTNQRKPKTYAKTLESALTAVSINFSAQKIHKSCCLNFPCILHLKRKIFFGYFSSFVDVRIKFFLSHFIHPPV